MPGPNSVTTSGLLTTEKGLKEIRDDLDAGRYTSHDLVIAYMQRIASFDKDGPKLNSILEINPEALLLADACDADRRAGRARGLLHGIPVVIKDNIDTADMMHTSAGSLALKDHYASKDAFVVQRLRQAGAIILGKTNMTEWANWTSTKMPGGYSSLGGQVLSAYDPSFPVRGSSTGSAVAMSANFAAAAIGTETSGSIIHPAYWASVVGLKPTVGLVSRSGIIPIAPSQDTAGPITRTIADAAMMLNVLAGVDPTDPVTFTAAGNIPKDYTAFLKKDGLRGARIGVSRQLFGQMSDEQVVLFDRVLKEMADAGAEIVDPAVMPLDELLATTWPDSKTMLYEFKPAINNYLKGVESYIPVHSLSDVVSFNNQDTEKRARYGQNILERAELTSGSLTEPEYIKERIRDLRLTRDAIDFTLRKYNLDAIIFPPMNNTMISGVILEARAGYPAITVPAGYLQDGKPFAFMLTASAWQEPKLISLAYGYEQKAQHRKPPIFSALP
ncbi:MAG: amidase family protein [Negativicutes bacterium]|nr:amidase family protein [Negativicutes bacterium]